jgi:LmbE family N-acetylglucosaminyl deacetylase
MSGSYIPERAMFIFAHPDDIEFGAAGTAAKWGMHGSEMTYVVITDGNIGSHDSEMTGEQLAQIRRAEQSAAAKIAGAKHCVFLGYHDGLLEPSLELRKELVKLIRIHKPNVVVCGDPTLFFRGDRINHPDHRAAAKAAIDAVFPSSEMHLLHPEFEEEGITPHKVNYVYVGSFDEANYYIDVTESIDKKIEALRQHSSQLGDWDPEERIKGRAADVGKRVGFAYAEAFRRMTLQPVETAEEEEESQG